MGRKPELRERERRVANMPRALDGLRVIDFTRVVAGPSCTMTLADFGADVVKIENPDGGDDTRAYDHAFAGGESAAYLGLNRNKRGIALDLGKPEGRAVALELIKRADILVENFSGGVMPKFGLDYETVAKHNPRLIYCSISAYGRQGEFANRPGFDPITQAESGFMSLNGPPDGPPLRTGSPIVDIATGLAACNAILMALVARDRIGRGQRVEVSLIDMATAMTGFFGMSYLMTGENPGRFGNSPNGSPTVGLYEASDGPIYMAVPNDRLYRRLVMEALDRPDLMTDPRFATRVSRAVNKAALRSALDEVFATNSIAHWMKKLKDVNIPVGYVRTIEEGFNSPEIRDRDRLSKIAHPTAGWVPNIEPPVQMSETPAIDPVAAPLLGQDTESVLKAWLGYSDAKLADLSRTGIFGASAGQP